MPTDIALRPTTENEVRDAVAAALAEGTPLEVTGSGSKGALGRYAPLNRRLELSALTGIALYEPEELVLTARAGTKLADIEAALAARGQCLAFEPPDYGALLGATPGAQTIGGVLACNLSGPRRPRAGAARDHFLGVRAVSGRGEVFKAGGRVVKNVTGYDMCKLLAGSYGTLAVMTEVTIKVLPAAEKVRTVLVRGLADAAAIEAMTEALNSPHDVSAAAHLPVSIAARSSVGYVQGAGAAVTAVRIEGPEPSVLARCQALKEMLAQFDEVEELHRRNSQIFWREVGDASLLAEPADRPVWRLSVPPSAGATVLAAIAARAGAQAFYDWGGGLVWVAVEDDRGAAGEAVRRAVAAHGGNAMLVRASAETRASVPVFPHLDPALARLTERIKRGFDPAGILNPGRMYDGI